MTDLTDDDVYSADTAENTPLLGCPEATIPPPPTATTIRKVLVLSCLLIFLLEFGAGLQIPSALALLEQRLCYEVQPGLPWPPLPDDLSAGRLRCEAGSLSFGACRLPLMSYRDFSQRFRMACCQIFGGGDRCSSSQPLGILSVLRFKSLFVSKIKRSLLAQTSEAAQVITFQNQSHSGLPCPLGYFCGQQFLC